VLKNQKMAIVVLFDRAFCDQITVKHQGSVDFLVAV
jgi:hypothetical protein